MTLQCRDVFLCFTKSEKKIMITYWKQSLTAMNIKSCYFLPWLSSMPPCLVFNLDTTALWSHLSICSFASSCNALFHIVFHPFVSITQILFFYFNMSFYMPFFLLEILFTALKKNSSPLLYTDLPKASLLFEVSLCGVWLSFLCYLCTSHIPPNKQ